MSDEDDRVVAQAMSSGDQMLAELRDQSVFSAVFPSAYADLLMEFALMGVSFVSEFGNESDGEPVSRRMADAIIRRHGIDECGSRCCAMIALREMYGWHP